MALIEPLYPKAGNGRRPRGLETMLRIDFMQQRFNVSDPGKEDALYDVPCMRAFARLDRFDESMPDETTILKFRRLLEKHQLTAANKRFNHKRSSVRSRVEHLFRVIKRQFGYPKVRCKGLAKNAAQVFPLIRRINPYLARRAMLT